MMNISGKKCLLDTNILLFAADRGSPLHQKSKELFQQIDEDRFQAYISVQNILEFAAVLTRGYNLHQKKVKDFIDRLLSDNKITLLFPNLLAFQIFMKLLQKETGVYVFDLFLAATAKAAGVSTIVSDDDDFRNLPGFTAYNPFR